MKRIVSIVVMVCLVVGGVVAQKAKPTDSQMRLLTVKGADKGEAAQTFIPEAGSVFFGTITYAVSTNNNPDAQQVSLSKVKRSAAMEKHAPKAQHADGTTADDKTTKAAIYFTKEGSFVSIGDMACWQVPGKPMYVAVERGEGEPLAGMDLGLDVVQMEEESEKMLERTGKTKEIAGVVTVLYLSHYPEMKGELWVAEEIQLKTSAVPYIGLTHPVLEFDYVVRIKEEEFYRAHLVAVSFEPDTFDKERVMRIQETEMAPQEVIFDALMKKRDNR